VSELGVLPKGWVSAKLLDISEIYMGQSPSASLINIEGKGLPFFQGKTEFTDVHPYINKHCEHPSRIAEENDILMSVRAPVGPVNIANRKSGFGRGLCAIRGIAGISYKYIFYQLRGMEKHIASFGTGSTFSGINRDKVESLNLNIAPEAEQTRIVEKLEELLSDLDNGVAELKAAQTKLTQYRQSLLKSAVEGSLTAEWRKQNPVTETGEQLLQRILTERRQRWEQTKLAEFKEKNNKPPKDWQLKYPEPVKPDTNELPELPVGWVWASVGQLCGIQGGIQKQPKRAPRANKYPFLRVANVYRNELRLDDVHEVELFDGELDRLRLELNDILIVEGNGSKSEIGRCAIWDDSIKDTVHQNHLIRARPVIIDSVYLLHWLNSHSGMDIMSTLAATTSGLYTLSVSKTSKIPVPLPPLKEQKTISNIIDSGLDDFNQQSKAIAASLKQSDAQRKNLLKDAFSGKLVPQDPNDEPASILLEKIKAERAELAKLPKPKRAKKKASEKSRIMDTLLEVLKAKGDWMGAQEAFSACGVSVGTDTDRIEELYAELRCLDKNGQLLCERKGAYDMLKLKEV